MTVHRALVLFCFILAASAATAQDSTDPGNLITGARIFNGVGPDLIEGQDVLVQNGLIAAIGEGLDAPEGATVIDAERDRVIPDQTME